MRVAAEQDSGRVNFGEDSENAERTAAYVAKARRKSGKSALKPDAGGRVTFGSPFLLGPASYKPEYLRKIVKAADDAHIAFALRDSTTGAAQPGQITITGVGEDEVMRWFWILVDDTTELLEGERVHRVPLDQMGERG